jgi:SsrA-binding protein
MGTPKAVSRDEKAALRQPITRNRKARFEYEILDTFEAGLVLVGPEVKSLREGNANLTDAYAVIRRGEVWLISAHISPYGNAARSNVEPRRERKCLLHRAEIERLEGKLHERGFTLVPLELYFKGGRVKVQLGLARGKRRHDKRETIRRREQDREMQRALRGRTGRQ